MMLLRARVSNIQSFACIWLNKGNQNEFFTHPKIKWLDGGFEPPTSEFPVHCSTTIRKLVRLARGRAMDRQSRGWGFQSPV